MSERQEIIQLVSPIANDLSSGAAELALQAIALLRGLVSQHASASPDELKSILVEVAQALTRAQPAMAPLFHLTNGVLLATQALSSSAEIVKRCDEELDAFETRLCSSASKIADHVRDLIPPGDLVFAYSFSSTVVSSLLHARSMGKFFRVVCTEARPSQEGRKLATMLASSGLEVVHTFDSAMGLVLPQCRVAFMGCDAVSRPGLTNKVGSWLLALACREMQIPLYALAGSEKFVDQDRFFEFENHERPPQEVWANAPAGVRVMNKQFELIPFKWIAGLVTEHGIMQEKDIEPYVDQLEVHESLKVAGLFA